MRKGKAGTGRGRKKKKKVETVKKSRGWTKGWGEKRFKGGNNRLPKTIEEVF